jgi:hypothetical protein
MPIDIEQVKRSPEYMELEKKIAKVSTEIKKLEGQKQYYESQYLMLARLKSSCNLDDSPANKKITKKEIAEKEKLIASLKTPQQCDIELKERIAEFEKLKQEYNTITVELEPLYLKAVTKYIDDKGIEIRQDAHGDRWWLYKGQTAEANTKITIENNIPTEIEVWQQNSDTRGNILRTKQKIIVVDKFIEKPKPKRKPYRIFKNLHEPTNLEPLPNPLELSKQTKGSLEKNIKDSKKGFLGKLLK